MHVKLIIAIGVMLASCKDAPPPAPRAVPAGPFQFAVDAKATRYTHFDAEGRLVVVAAADDVPPHVRAFTGVLPANQPSPPDGQLYLWLEGDDARIGSAQLVERAPLERSSGAAWGGFEASMQVWETTLSIAGPDGKQPLARKTPRSRKSSVAAREPQARIVIDGLDGDAPDEKTPKVRAPAAQEREVVAAWGWEDVTLYYSKSCGYCRQAMKWMDTNHVPYRRIDIDTPSGGRAFSSAAARARVGTGVPFFEIGKERQPLQGWHKDKFVAMAKR